MAYTDGDVVVPDIAEDYNSNEPYSNFIQRYFTLRYAVNVKHERDDYCVLIHSNRVCVITLAPTHEILKEPTIELIDSQISEKTNTLNTKISGKRKRNAQRVQPNSTLLIAKCGSKIYKLVPGIHGKLLEVNEELLSQPNLLLRDPSERGFIAIILPDPSQVEDSKLRLLTEEAYQEHWKALNLE